MGTRNLTAILATALIQACVAGPDAELEAAIQPADHTFTAAAAEATWTDAELQLRITGDLAGESVVVNVDLDRAAVEALPADATLPISGETFFESATWATFDNGDSQSPAVLRAWIFGSCSNCDVGQSFQALNGGLTINQADLQSITGAIALTITGRVPAWSNDQEVRITVQVPFSISLVQPIAPAPPQEDPLTEQPQEPAPPQQPEQPEQPVEPEAPAPPVIDGNTISGEVTLLAEMGINFATGEVVKPANFANCDLFASAGTSFLKLTPGGNTPVNGQPLRWFTTPGGLIETFASIAEVPNVVPTAADGSKSIVNAKKGIGFVVANNTSAGYTRVWIKHGQNDRVTIQYVTTLP